MASKSTDPTFQDLGVLDGPVLLFGGVYSNLEALQAMLNVARDRWQIPPERVIHTGDVVAYCANPLESTELLRGSGVRCLMGNCEESVGTGQLDCGCGFPEDSKCNEFSVNWYAHVMRELGHRSDLISWMATLPRRIAFTVGGRKLHVVHGSTRGIAEFLWPSTTDEELLDCMARLPADVDGVVAGHSGLPFVRLVPGEKPSDRSRLWLNAGVIGMPANDGTTRVWYSVLIPRGADLEVKICSLEFDAKSAAEAVYAETRLNVGYGDALRTGIWPSHDILPLEEQIATDMPLKEQTLLWQKDRVGCSFGLLYRVANLFSSPVSSFFSSPFVAVTATVTAALIGYLLSNRSRTCRAAVLNK